MIIVDDVPPVPIRAAVHDIACRASKVNILAVGTFALLTVAISWTQWRFPRVRPLVSGRPVLVLRHGELLEDAMKSQRLAVADVLVAAREEGIRRTSDIEFAVLEADGRMSFFTYETDDASGAPEKPPAG